MSTALPEAGLADPTSDSKAPLWKRLLPIAGALVIVVVIFGWVLPQFIDYEAAFCAIGDLDALSEGNVRVPTVALASLIQGSL